MGGLNAALLALLVLLAPGFLFFAAFFGAGRLSRNDRGGGLLTDAAALVTASATIHLLVGTPAVLIATPVVGAEVIDDVFAILGAETGKPPSALRGAAALLVLYFIAGSAAALAAGFLSIRFIEASDRPLAKVIGRRLTHPSYFDLIQGKGSVFEFDADHFDYTLDFVIATAVSDIEKDGRCLAYRGRVVDIGHGPAHAVAMFDGSDVPDHARTARRVEQFVITGARVRNVAFQRFRFDVKSTSDEDAEILAQLRHFS